MGKVSNFMKDMMELADKKSPAILTGIAVCGLFTTIALTYKAAPKIDRIVKDGKKDLAEAKKRKALKTEERKIQAEMVKKVVVTAAPTVLMATATAGCIIGSNRISSKRVSVLSAAYAVSEAAVKDLNGKMTEVLGEKKTQQIKDAIAKDKLDKKLETPTNPVIVTGGGNIRCIDNYTGNLCWTTAEKVERAIFKLSNECATCMYVSLNELYSEIGAKQTELGDELGWNAEDLVKGQLPITFFFGGDENNKEPCLYLDYTINLRKDFRNLH